MWRRREGARDGRANHWRYGSARQQRQRKKASIPSSQPSKRAHLEAPRFARPDCSAYRIIMAEESRVRASSSLRGAIQGRGGAAGQAGKQAAQGEGAWGPWVPTVSGAWCGPSSSCRPASQHAHQRAAAASSHAREGEQREDVGWAVQVDLKVGEAHVRPGSLRGQGASLAAGVGARRGGQAGEAHAVPRASLPPAALALPRLGSAAQHGAAAAPACLQRWARSWHRCAPLKRTCLDTEAGTVGAEKGPGVS